MEGNAFNLDQENSKIAGAAAALFSDSIEQSPFDSLASEQTTTDYSSHYDYNNGSNALQENTDGTVTNSMVTQQYGGFEYNHYHEGQYVNGTTESVTSPQANTITQNQHDYTGYAYDDASYTNGQDNSQFYYSQQQYYDPSQQQYDPYYYQTYNPNQTYDPNQAYNLNQSYDPSQTYYPNQTFDQNHYDPSLYSQDPSTYYQYTQQLTEINNSNEINFQNLTIDPNSNKELSNSKQKEGGEDTVNSNGIPNNTDSVGEVGTTYDGSKQNIDDALKSDAVPSNLFVDTFKSDNENREISSDNKENEHSPTINQDIDPNFKIQEHLTISSSSDLTSPINDNVAAVTLVETIETNKESSQYTVTSSKKENASRINSPAENDNDLNGLENEDQEVNITYGDDRDIFEYQPQELESHPKSELSQAEPPVSLIDDSKIMSEVSAAGDTEEINDKPKDEPTKLDDLDDLVLGSASKPGNLELEGLANTHEGHSIPSQNIDTTALNSSYQYEYSGQYNYGYEHWGSNDENSRYQGYDPNLQTGDVTTGTEQVNYQYQGYDASQTSRGTTTETDLANYQYNEYDTNQTAAEPITEKEQILYQSYDTSQAGFDNTVATNYQYPAYETNQSAAIETVAEADQSNYQYLGYNMGEIAVDGTDGQGQFNYPYQEHETGQVTIDNNDETSQVNYQYTSYDASQINHQATSQPTVDNKVETEQPNYYQGYQHVPSHPSQTSPPPMSPSPKGSILISCPYPQCGGENKSTAKFCSDCGKQINSNVMHSIIPAVGISEVMTTEIYNNNANAYSEQYSASSFASYGNHDTQYLERDSGVSLDPLQSDYQQYYGTDDVNAVNDPLGRTKGCRPIIAFGFGGKMFTMFPRTVQRFTSTDQSTPITKSAPGVFSVRVLKDIIPASDITDFPGPLLMDNNRGGIKAKRKSVLKYLDDQIQVTETKLSSFNGEEIEKKELEMIIIVWNLFKIMFENDGMLIGSSKVEELVRNILVPFASKSDNDEVNFTVPADTSFEDLSQTPESTSLTYSVSSKAVDKLQELLLKGDRVVAINHAMNENLWAHALIIASCVNKDLWKEVVTGFIKREMGTQKGEALESNGRESLRVLYSLFAGQGQNAAKEFLPYSNLLNRITQSPVAAMIPTLPNTSHYSSNPNVPYGGASISTSHSSSSARDVPLDSLVKWRETIAMILANRAPGDNQVISALGDMLKECGWVHAAHICYMLSPTVSIISGSDAPNVRFTLLGMDYTHNLSISNFHNWQSLRMTEIYEFGLSLNSNDGGLPHLQAYKLLYAWWLADCGYLNESRRYCESIANIVKVYTKGSPYFHGCFLQKLKDLTQRLLEHGGNNNGINETSSWLFAKKMPKATLDSLWGSLEGKFHKFVAGDTVDENVTKTSFSKTQEAVGPFSHFSSITHPTSEVPSRSASASDFRSIPNPIDTRRATTPNAIIQRQLNGNQQRLSTPTGVQYDLVNSYNSNFSPTTPDGQNTMSSVPEGGSIGTSPTDVKNEYNNWQSFNNSQQYNGHSNEQQSTQSGYNYSLSDNPNAEANNKQKQQAMYPYYQPLGNNTSTYNNDSAWWSSPNADSNVAQNVDQAQTDVVDGGDFISPMDSSGFTPFFSAPAPAPAPVTTTDTSNRNNDFDDDFDDLGLGNNAFGTKKKNDHPADSEADTGADTETNNNTPQTEQKHEAKQEDKKEEKTGWFGRWFGKKEVGGKTANLGEESSFYFDPVQKRWINKKAGAETINASTSLPPPPQRSKTTSPQRSQSLTSSNPSRQSLPPTDNKNFTGPPISATPPPQNKGGRASSASMKKRARSKYVDIMNQPT